MTHLYGQYGYDRPIAVRCADAAIVACRRDGVVRIYNASLAYEDDFEDDVSDEAEVKASSPVEEEPPAKAVDAKASTSVVFAPAQRRGLAPRNTTKDRRRLSTSDLEDVKRRAAQPKADGASVDDAITEILMGRKAKHELEARLEALERAARHWGAGEAAEAFRALSGRNFSWEAVGDFLERIDVSDLTLDAASTLAECAERWLKACGARYPKLALVEGHRSLLLADRDHAGGRPDDELGQGRLARAPAGPRRTEQSFGVGRPLEDPSRLCVGLKPSLVCLSPPSCLPL